MSGLVWSRRAVADLERLHDASAKRGGDLARRAARAIREGLRLIAARPEVGRPVGGADPAFRERPVAFGRGGGCLLLYRTDGARVVVLAVRDAGELVG